MVRLTRMVVMVVLVMMVVMVMMRVMMTEEEKEGRIQILASKSSSVTITAFGHSPDINVYSHCRKPFPFQHISATSILHITPPDITLFNGSRHLGYCPTSPYFSGRI